MFEKLKRMREAMSADTDALLEENRKLKAERDFLAKKLACLEATLHRSTTPTTPTPNSSGAATQFHLASLMMESEKRRLMEEVHKRDIELARTKSTPQIKFRSLLDSLGRHPQFIPPTKNQIAFDNETTVGNITRMSVDEYRAFRQSIGLKP